MPYLDQVRVRIAPSPTGDPHVGTAYVALFNYIFARKHGGKFLLRIEDTDQVRAKASSEEMIIRSLKWLGLNWDEGPDIGGDFGPYRQSERTAIYKKHADLLVEQGKAYPCFCTAQRLDEVRAVQKAEGRSILGYDRHCRDLTKDDVKQKKESGIPYVIRLKMKLDGMLGFFDELRGQVEFEAHRMDDQVLLKSDGYPTYHLANVVDDHLMKISHVIRAEEWISSTPKHTALYEAFGWEQPKFAHLPLLRNADRSKISKRKNPVALTYYQRAGFLPSALLNFLANMGWSYGNDIEVYSLQAMQEKFELKDINLGGPVFDIVKLTWMNQLYMHQMTEDEFVTHLRGNIFTDSYLRSLKPLVLERMNRFEQFVDNNSFFFNGALDYKGVEIVPKGKTSSDVVAMLDGLLEKLDDLYEWNHDSIKITVDTYKDAIGWKAKDVFMTLRLIATGRKDSPPLFESLEIVGREMVRFRIRDCMQFLKSTP
ncbi:MAG: glutamate--tRNA ligase [Proteobacteria bacterium]|nr:glutamate--tRNA ligase [Pseudomonadota bacterium]